MPNQFADDPLVGSTAAPALPLRITVHPSRYYDDINASTNDAQGPSASTQAAAPETATAQPKAMFGADTPWWLNPSATTVQSPGLTDDDLSADAGVRSPAQEQAAVDVREWLAQKIALGEAPREWHRVRASDATGDRGQTAPNWQGPNLNIGNLDDASVAARDAARRLDDWVALKAPNGPPHSDWAIWRRARDGFVGGFGDRPLGLPLEERARYPVSEMLQPFAAPVDFGARLVSGGLYGAAGLIAGAYEDAGGSPASANGLQRDLGVVGQYPIIEGPALPRPTYWPPARRSAPRSPVDRSPSADPRTVDVNQPREAAPQPSSPTPNAQTADQSARSILIPSERNAVTGTDEKPVGRRPFSGKDVQPDTGGSDFQDPQTLDAWLAHAANVARGRDDGSATGAPARLGAARFETPTSEASRSWYGADLDEVPHEPRADVGERSPDNLSPENAQFLYDYLGLRPQDFYGTVRNINGRIWVAGDLLRNGEIVGQISRSAKAETATAVHHNIGILPELRGQGLTKSILAANIGFYRKNGINRVLTSAGDEDGGYTWARYGFVPEAESWAVLRGKLTGRLNQIAGLPDRQYNRIKELLLSPDPKAIWGIADNQTRVPDRKNSTQITTLGKRLLRGSHWKGYMDLNDNEINNRFDDYVRDRPRW